MKQQEILIDPLSEYNNLIIYSPHFDDAFLSLGGYLGLSKKFKKNVIIVIIFGLSSYQNKKNYPNEDIILISQKRKMEELQNIEYLSCELKVFNNPCALSRGYKFERNNPIPWPTKFLETDVPTAALVRKMIYRYAKSQANESLHLFPSAIGDHIDHVITNQAGWDLYRTKINIAFYEDLPYAANYSIDKKIVNLTPIILPVDINDKLKFILNYKTQNTIEWIDEILNYMNSLNSHNGEFHERIWL